MHIPSKYIPILLLLLALTACEKENFDVVPDVYVDFSIRLDDPEFQALNAVGNTVYITRAYDGYRSAGYDNNGILIYRASGEEFYAYDATCPHDFAVNGLSVAVEIENSGDLFAVCPSCQSSYILPAYGAPTDDSESAYPLKNYRTSFNGLYLRVYH